MHANVVTVEMTRIELSSGAQIYSSPNDKLPIVIDTGASVTLTPNVDNFVGQIRYPLLPG